MNHSGAGWLVVGSTAAGSSGQELIEAVAGRLARSAPAEVAVTASPDDLDRALVELGERVLVVVGGDGSAHVAINALGRLDLLDSVTVGFVPLGTANDLATHLGMTTEPGDAADQIERGAVRRLDVLRLTGDGLDSAELVVNALHAGLGVDGARRAEPLKPVLGPLAYPFGVVASGIVSRGSDVAVRVDGETLDLGGPLLAVAVANAPRLGGVELVDEADPEDGLLDVLAVPGRPWRSRVRSVARAAGRRSSAVTVRRGSVVELEGDLGEVDADGEMITVGAACRVEVLPGALSVLSGSA